MLLSVFRVEDSIGLDASQVYEDFDEACLAVLRAAPPGEVHIRSAAEGTFTLSVLQSTGQLQLVAQVAELPVPEHVRNLLAASLKTLS